MSDGYFNSYCDLSVHELMLKDRARTLAYRNFFQENRDIVKDKIVMDVGAGTGILSLFAASAGAKKVYAVEASDVADLCKEIVEENELDGIITVMKGPVEEISLPENEKVDIIVSEWMGFYLLHESMLDSVLCARDRFLAPDGYLVPSHAHIFMAPVNMADHFTDRAEEWSNIYGFDFSPIASIMNLKEVSEPLIKVLNCVQICSAKEEVVSFDLKNMSLDEVKVITNCLKFQMSQESMVHGFAFWFSVDFASPGMTSSGISESKDASGTTLNSADKVNEMGDAKINKTCSESLTVQQNEKMNVDNVNSKSKNEKSLTVENEKSQTKTVVLDTSPFSTPTHWKQTIVFLPQTIMVEKGINLCCKVHMAQDKDNKRHYNITLQLDGDGINDTDDFDFDGDGQEVGDELESDAESDEATDHPVPCSCGSDHCRLIAALVQKYDAEHDELEGEAEMVEVSAEVEAAKQLDADIEKEGWQVEGNLSEISVDGEAADT